MKTPLSVQKPEQLLLAILLAYSVALGFQIKKGEHTLFGKLALTAFLPLINGTELTMKTFKEGFQAYVWQKDVAIRNEEMLRENLMLRGEISVLKPLEEENRKLKALLEAPPPDDYRFTVARSIILYGAPYTRSLLVAVQEGSSVTEKSPVIDIGGVIGRIEEVSGAKARVLLLTDPASAIGVTDQRSGVHGVAMGDGRNLKVRYITNEADITDGDVFVTSGEDGVFPPGLQVGKVTSAADGGDYMKRITLTPAASLESLSYVVVLQKVR